MVKVPKYVLGKKACHSDIPQVSQLFCRLSRHYLKDKSQLILTICQLVFNKNVNAGEFESYLWIKQAVCRVSRTSSLPLLSFGLDFCSNSEKITVIVEVYHRSRLHSGNRILCAATHLPSVL